MGLIRLLLALSVVISHSHAIFGFTLVGGPIAVQSFFIISGFYMALVLNEKYFDPGIPQKKSYQLFITNRFLKLFPVYWIILILTLVVSAILFKASGGTEMGRLDHFIKYKNQLNGGTWVFLIFTNIAMFFQDAVLFLGLDPQTGGLYFTKNYEASNPVLHGFLLIPQAWSVAIELVFYIIAPFILRKGLKLIVPLFILSFVLRIILYTNGFNQDPWTSRFIPLELGFFLLGGIAYHIYSRLKLGRYGFSFKPLAFIIVACSIIFYNFVQFDLKMIFYFILFFLLLPFIFELSKKSKIDRFLGDLSYPVYISHLLVLMVLVQLKISTVYHLGLYLAIFSLLFSVALHVLVSGPIERFRQKRIAR